MTEYEKLMPVLYDAMLDYPHEYYGVQRDVETFRLDENGEIVTEETGIVPTEQPSE